MGGFNFLKPALSRNCHGNGKGGIPMEKKGFKTLTNLLSKTAGLVFFSFLAISLGVVFGLLFDGWVKDQPGAAVDSRNNNLETVDLPIVASEQNNAPSEAVKPSQENSPDQLSNRVSQVGSVKYKVRVGPYSNRNQAMVVSGKLATMGYPVFVGKNPPFTVQVGAFATRKNAEKLKNELNGIGYKSFIQP
jgi:hypothetical protein